MPNNKYDLREKRLRDAIIFLLGIIGSINELWIQPEPRPYALAFLASLIGVPFILHADSLRRKSENNRKNGDRHET